MRSPVSPHLQTMRAVLTKARAENARMAAAAIGGHLAEISKAAPGSQSLDEAREAVRDASFDLLRSFHRATDSAEARRTALAAMDELERSLQDAAERPTSALLARKNVSRRRWPWTRG